MMVEEGTRQAAQLLGVCLCTNGCAEGFVAKDLDIVGVVDCMRCCKRAPVPGLCQAFAEKASGPRMAEGRDDWAST